MTTKLQCMTAAAQIASTLFTNEHGDKAYRIVLKLYDGTDGGGWIETVVADMIAEQLEKSFEAANETRGKQTDEKEHGDYSFAIPLRNGSVAVVRIPYPTKARGLQDVISTLELWRDGLTTKDENANETRGQASEM